MTDDGILQLLRSDHPLVVVEAPAGTGKTHQGASYANSATKNTPPLRILILTHTHAACSVFSERTKEAGSRVEIKTIDALVIQIASAYHKALNLPADTSVWARKNGFAELAKKVEILLTLKPMIALVLARRYPIIICDEYQDTSANQHSILMALHKAGAKLRVFGDPMQRIYGTRTDKAIAKDRALWAQLKENGEFGDLENPHRWKDGSLELGIWILEARKSLLNREPIDLTKDLPSSLIIIRADNISKKARGYQLSREQRKPIDNIINTYSELLVLASTNEAVREIRSFFNRRIPIWEGHTRDSLSVLVEQLSINNGNASAVAVAVVQFLCEVTKGFSNSSHGKRLIQEINEGCQLQARGKPKHIQDMARRLIENPNHKGVSMLLLDMKALVDQGVSGFGDIKFDYLSEYNDAIRLGNHEDPEDGFSEITRRRSYLRPKPPSRCLSTIHKAKGLECNNAILMACDSAHFPATDYARCKLYVALSRARYSLTLVVPNNKQSPLIKI